MQINLLINFKQYNIYVSSVCPNQDTIMTLIFVHSEGILNVLRMGPT